MKDIKEITIFTVGDATDLQVFSNIPYFIYNTLEAKGIKVNRVNISENRILQLIYKATIWQLLKLCSGKPTYTYFRSIVNALDVRFRIKKAIKKYPGADIHLFTTFSFSSVGMTSKPIVLFGDWTYDYYFNYFLNKKPKFFEKIAIKRESKYIEQADFVFVLFPYVTEYMKNHYSNKNIYYQGNVINALYKPHNLLPQKKQNACNLLFIGKNVYKEGAECLIESFRMLKNEIPALRLHIVGMEKSDFSGLPEDVMVYGYLNKGIKEQCDLFYNLLEEASVFINSTPKWGAFSATLEAMYFYTPVVVTPYTEFISTFGSEITFGHFCESNDPALLSGKIKEILYSPSYISLSENAHNAVKEFTWDNYVNKMLEIINSK